MAPLSRDNKALNAKHAALLKDLLKLPANKVCADCKRNDARWASVNLGVFMCIRCSGIHRSLGVHISRIKSVDLDTWLPEQVANVQKWGNTRANAYWEAHLREGHVVPEHKIEAFIRSKYESRRWARDGPLPDDPSVLDPAGSAAPIVEAAAAPPTAPPPKASSRAIDLLDGPVASTAAPQRKSAAAPAKPAPPVATGGSLFDLDFSPAATTQAQTQQHTAQRTAVKSDIMSLFSAAPPAAPALQQQPSRPSAFDDFGSFGAPPAASSFQQQQQSPNTFNSFPSYAAPAPSQPTHGSAFGSFGSAAAAPTAPPQQRNVTASFADMSIGPDPWASSSAAVSTSSSAAPARSTSLHQPSTSQSGIASLWNSADVWGSSSNAGGGDAFGDFGSSATSSHKPQQSSTDAFSSLWQ